MLLPRTDKNGKPRISYSQVKSWMSDTAFNKVLVNGDLKEIGGREGYILQYFLDYSFPPSPMDIYAPFGQAVEDAICTRDFSKFPEEEALILQSIVPVGVFQKEVNIDFGDFVLSGFIDDCDAELSYLRDYKTVSKSKIKQYYSPEYFQLDTYALANYFTTGDLPEKMEVVAILRGGSHKQLPLKVTRVEYIDRKVDVRNLIYAEAKIRGAVKEISMAYETFLEFKTRINEQ